MPFPVDLKYIKETEKELGVQFPRKFVRKMSVENGGEIMTDEDNWQLIPFFDKSDSKRISRTCHHIIQETENAREWNGFPVKGIAIATNDSGDYLVLLPCEANPAILKEEIYIWLHETAEITEAANSIEELTEIF
jgi:hypothetical protein